MKVYEVYVVVCWRDGFLSQTTLGTYRSREAADKVVQAISPHLRAWGGKAFVAEHELRNEPIRLEEALSLIQTERQYYVSY